MCVCAKLRFVSQDSIECVHSSLSPPFDVDASSSSSSSWIVPPAQVSLASHRGGGGGGESDIEW